MQTYTHTHTRIQTHTEEAAWTGNLQAALPHTPMTPTRRSDAGKDAVPKEALPPPPMPGDHEEDDSVHELAPMTPTPPSADGEHAVQEEAALPLQLLPGSEQEAVSR